VQWYLSPPFGARGGPERRAYEGTTCATATSPDEPTQNGFVVQILIAATGADGIPQRRAHGSQDECADRSALSGVRSSTFADLEPGQRRHRNRRCDVSTERTKR